MRNRIGLSSWRLELCDGIVRLPPRNQAMRPANYEDRYDFQTVVYDVFWASDHQSVVLTAAPFLSLERDLPLTAKALLSGERCALATHVNPNFTRLTLTPPAGTTGIEIDSPAGRIVLAIQPSLAHLFRDRRVIYTLQQNNDLEWIRDWAFFYAREHGADAAVIYDNGSTRYEPGEVADALESVPGIAEVAVVDWPFPYGAFDLREELSWNLIDSIYCQFAAFDHLNRRLTPLAAGVLNADLDEIVVRTGTRTLFEAAAEAPGGYVQFEGYWVENVRAPGRFGEADARHRDFHFVAAPEPAVSEPKWAMVPGRLGDDVVLSVHDLHNAYRGPAEDFCLYHFKGINTMWDTDRPLIGQRREEVRFDAAAGTHAADDVLAAALGRVFADDPGYTGAGRPVGRPETGGHIARIRSGRAKRDGRTEAAIALGRAAIALLPGMQSFHEHLAALLGETGEAERLRRRAAELREADYGFHLQRARKLFDFGDPEQSAAVYRRCLDLVPGDPVALQGWLYCLTEIEAHGEAVAAAAQAVEDAPEYSTFASLVPVFRALGKWREAERLVGRALERNPDDPYLVGLLAAIYVVMRRIPEARAALGRARALQTPAAFRERLAIVNRRGRPSREYAEWDPEQGRLTHIEAQIALAEGRIDAAEALSRDAAARAYPFPPYEMHLADVLDRQGKAEAARAVRRRAVALAERRAVKRPPTHFGPRAAGKFRQRNFLGLMQVLIGSGETERALAVIGRARAEGLASSEFLAAAAQHWLAAGDTGEAERAVREALALAPENARLLGLLGRTLAAGGDTDGAIAALAAAVARDGAAADLWLALADGFEAAGRADEAVAAVREAIAADPAHRQAQHRLVAALTAGGRLPEAEAAARAAIAADPPAALPHLDLVDVLVAADRLDAAIGAAAAGREACPQHLPLALTHTGLLGRAGRHAAAEAAAGAATRLAPTDGRAWNALGQALMAQSKWAEAIAAYRELAPLSQPEDRPGVRRRLANLLLREGRLEEAAREAAALDADDPEVTALRETIARRIADREAGRAAAATAAERGAAASFGRARALIAEGRLADAQSALEEAIAAAPNAAGYRVALANVLVDQGLIEAALERLDSAIVLEPESAPLRARRAHLLGRLGRHEDSIRALRYAIELAPGDADLKVRLGNAMLAQHRRDEAIAAFRAALAIAPAHEIAATRLKDLGVAP